MILQIVKELETKNHFFLYIDKRRNSVINYQNAYAKFEWNPFINTEVIERKQSEDGRTDGRTDTRPADMKT